MSKGGGGSSQTVTEQKIPEWMEAGLKENMARAQATAELGYMPWYGPDVAALNPTQLAAMQSNIGAAEAFGLIPQGSLTAGQGMPEPAEYAGGIMGYGSGGLFDQAVAELAARNPDLAKRYNALFGGEAYVNNSRLESLINEAVSSAVGDMKPKPKSEIDWWLDQQMYS